MTVSEVSTLSNLRKPEYYHSLKNTIIADSSYAALCLGDYLTSLQKAEELLSQSNLSGNHKYEFSIDIYAKLGYTNFRLFIGF